MTPKFSTSTTILIENKPDLFSSLAKIEEEFRTGQATTAVDVLSETQIISSRHLANKVIDELALVLDPEFNADLRPKTWFTEITGGIKGAVRAVMTVVFGSAEVSEERRKEIEHEEVVDTFLDNLTVTQLSEASRLFRVSFMSEEPGKAARIANALADAYIVDQLDAQYDQKLRASQWLTQKIASLRQSVAEKERAAEEYRQSAGLLAGLNGNTLISQQISDLNAQLIVARTSRTEAEARLGQIRRLASAPGGASAAADVLGSPVIQSLLTQEAEVKREVAQLADEYGERHPRMISARSELRDVQAKISAEIAKVVQKLDNDYGVAKAREAALVQSLNELKARLGQSNAAEVQLRALERDAQAERTMLESFLNRFEETSSQLNLNQQGTVRILSRATGPQSPSFPRKMLTMVVVFFGSVVLGIGLVFLLEQFDRGFRSEEQLERMTGVRSLGMIPILKDSRRFRGNPASYVAKYPASQFGEAIRSLYTSIIISNPEQAPKSILITSCQPQEGKTTISASLARMSAASGRRVVLVDADMRRARVHQSLGLPAQPGLVEYLTERAPLADVLHKDHVSGAFVIPAGGPADDPTRILASPNIRLLVDALSKPFDLIILDSAPLMAVADPRMLAPQVDGAILVVRWGETNRNVVGLGIRKLFETGARVDGVVLSMVDSQKHARYGAADSAYYDKSVKRYYTT
jgi:succinoglycan biosynthesis transport protein ExoP